MTASMALLIGAWILPMISLIFSLMPPRPSRSARKLMMSGMVLASDAFDQVGHGTHAAAR